MNRYARNARGRADIRQAGQTGSHGRIHCMVSAGDFRNGITFEEDGNVFQIVEFQHVKPGKGAAFVRTKIRNVITGSVVERT